MNAHADIVIVGAGIAGASLAYFLTQADPKRRVVLLEAEDQPGHHSTGRSAAAFIEGYGPAQVRGLSRASLPFFRQPPAGFAEHPLLLPRGMLVLARDDQRHALDERQADADRERRPFQRWTKAEVLQRVPALRPDVFDEAGYDPEATDIDVHSLHQGYLRGARQAGTQLLTGARIDAVHRLEEGWRLSWRNTQATHTLDCGLLVNAAGAWADELATMAGCEPLALQPCRRSAWRFRPQGLPPSMSTGNWPLIMSEDESWYLKPDAGELLASPANADPTVPQDVQPEIEDIALGIERIEANFQFRVGRPTRTWAGLRTFAPDGQLINGFDPQDPSFFWVAGQGGYGIQTSPAMGRAGARLLLGQPLGDDFLALGLTEAALSPQRLKLEPTPSF